ncbi:hypothetical protein VFPYRLAN_128 [Candidatus Vidania fulgoroideae]|nr:hypothetical protein VFPYRLAN_128 [Candidatus Vidania fulgoroideae]
MNRKQKIKNTIFIKNETYLHDNIIILLLVKEKIFNGKRINKNCCFITNKNHKKVGKQIPIKKHKGLVVFCDSKNSYRITNDKLLTFFLPKKKVNTYSFFKCINLIGTFNQRLYSFIKKKKKDKKPPILDVFRGKNLLKIHNYIK